MNTTEEQAKTTMEQTMFKKLRESIDALNQAIWFDSTMIMLYGRTSLTQTESARLTEARNDLHAVLDLIGNRQSQQEPKKE